MCQYEPKHGKLLDKLLLISVISILYFIFFIRLNDTDQLLLQIRQPVLSGGEGFGPGFPTIFIWTIFPRRILFFSANMTKILHEYKTFTKILHATIGKQGTYSLVGRHCWVRQPPLCT